MFQGGTPAGMGVVVLEAFCTAFWEGATEQERLDLLRHEERLEEEEEEEGRLDVEEDAWLELLEIRRRKGLR